VFRTAETALVLGFWASAGSTATATTLQLFVSNTQLPTAGLQVFYVASCVQLLIMLMNGDLQHYKHQQECIRDFACMRDMLIAW
jgi:hypothetical protein